MCPMTGAQAANLGGGMQSHMGYHDVCGRRVATVCHAIARNNSAQRENPGGVMPEPTEGPTVLRILLGTQLRRLRESRGISAQEAARAIRGSESKISRIELGRNAVREIDIADLLTLYGITDKTEREQMLLLASRANQPGWWHQYHDVLPA